MWKLLIQLKCGIFLLFIHYCGSLRYGDRVSTLIQTLHSGWKSTWTDIEIHKMPKFQVEDTSILEVMLPRNQDNGEEMRLNPNDDVKMTLTFDRNKLMIPWTVLFDSSERTSLNKLIITFDHNEFEILRVDYKPVYGPPIQRLDPHHPSIRTVELNYRWQPVQEQDLAYGLYALFTLSLLILMAMTVYFALTYDREELIGKEAIKKAQRTER